MIPSIRPLLTAIPLVAACIADAADQPQLGERFTRNPTSAETNLPEKVNPATGEGVRWTAKLGSQSYSTPVISQGKILVGTNNDSPRDPRHQGDRGILYCLDEKSGGFLWQLVVPKIGGGDGMLYGFEALTAMPPAGIVANLKRVWKYDPDPTAPKTDVHSYNANREISPSTIVAAPVFLGDRIYLTVGGDIWWGKYQAWLQCVTADQTGDTTGTAMRWSCPMKHSITTPAVAGPLAFVADTGNKTLICVDTATGKELWSHPLGSEIWSSPLVADGKLYLGTRRGKFFIFAATREKKLLCQTTFDDPIDASPVAANGVVYVATHTTLYALAKP